MHNCLIQYPEFVLISYTGKTQGQLSRRKIFALKAPQKQKNGSGFEAGLSGLEPGPGVSRADGHWPRASENPSRNGSTDSGFVEFHKNDEFGGKMPAMQKLAIPGR